MDEVGKETLEVMSKASWYNKWLLGKIKPFLGKKILEVGAGNANFTLSLAEFGEVTAIDIQKIYLRKLKKIKGVRSGFGDVEKGEYFFTNEKFDTVVCMNVLEHIENDGQALKNMHSLIKRSGYLILLVPAHKFLYSPFDEILGHFRRYTLKVVRQKLEDVGFEEISVRYLNFLGALGWFFWFKLIRLKRMPKSQVRIFDFLARLFLLPERFVRMPLGLSVLAIAKK